MKVLLRADASPTQGTGHVMRCLTLSEALISCGHSVTLLTNESGVPWLEGVISRSGIPVCSVPQHSMNFDLIKSYSPDWVVVDSYEIDSAEIAQLGETTDVLAIVDSTTRDIDARMYLDHNLGAEEQNWVAKMPERVLAGSNYALIRDAVIAKKRERPWQLTDTKPHIVAFMGGSDPTGTIIQAATAIAALGDQCRATIVVNDQWRGEVVEIIAASKDIQCIAPTPDLHTFLGNADIAISASGTSAWELCTLGIPSILISVVDNQVESLKRLTAAGLVLGIDAVNMSKHELTEQIHSAITTLMSDEGLRKTLSQNSTAVFDGLGKHRVVEAMEVSQQNTEVLS